MSPSTAASQAWSGTSVRCWNVVQIYRTAGGHDVVALRGVNLDIGPGEQVALLGPSGSGKSTLLSLFGGVLRPSAGKVIIDGHDISRASESEINRLRSGKVASLLQGASRNLLPYVGAVENIEFARRGLTPLQRRLLPKPGDLLRRLGMVELAGRPTGSMAGGERQRVALASAVASGAGLLLADEPTSQLGHDDRDLMLALLDQLNQEFGTTIVLVTHDPAVAESMQRSITIRNGRIGSEGRRGSEFGVVDDDGTVHIPEEMAETFPAGMLVKFEETLEGLLVRPVDTPPTDRSLSR